MKVETRKKAAIWLVGIYFWVIVLNILLRYIYGDVFLSKEYSIGYFSFLFGVIPLFIRGGLLVGCVSILGRLLNKVTRCFFYKSVAGLAVLPFIEVCINCFLNGSDFTFISLVAGLFEMLLLMSGAGMIRQNLSVDAYAASKLRLFQTGVVLNYGFSCISSIVFWVWDGYYFGALFPLSFGDIISWIGIICIIWGLIGIIKSDLIGENRKEDGDGKISGGWLSRPVAGAVCFLALWGFLILLIPDVCNLLNIELW